MSLDIQEIGVDLFPLYDAIPNCFRVKSVLRVEVVDGGLGGFRFTEEKVAEPFIRDYDSQNDDNPTSWAARFDTSKWGIFLARDGDRPLAAATIAIDAAVYPMDRFQRKDLAVLWDIRVHPDERRRGIGARLFKYAVDWSRRKGYGQLGMETQNTNVPACRFCAKQGCQLGAIHRYGYAGCPDAAHEVMLLWYLDL